MRSKLIVVYASLVVLMGILAFGFVRQAVSSANHNPAALAERARQESAYVAARIEVAALAQERWLSSTPLGAGASEVMQRGTPEARGDAATSFCDGVIGAAAGALGMHPALALMVDPSGRIVGRNGSSLSRGEDLGAVHAPLKASLASGVPGSEVWFQPERNEQFLVSYAPTFAKDHSIVGALVLGVPLPDVLNAASGGSSASTIALAQQTKGETVELAAVRGAATSDGVRAQLIKVGQAGLGSIAPVSATAGEVQLASTGLVHLGTGKATAVAVSAPEQLAPGLDALPMSLIGLFALLLVMTIAAGWLLGGYIQKPVEDLEEGLLAILNGQHDKRFNLEHAELGGLGFRIDQLLNQLMGVEEDDSDDEGRVSSSSIRPPQQFDDVEEGNDDASLAHRLRAEPADAYYARVYREYIDAKTAIGEDVSHISADTFRERIAGMEAEALGKHGRPVRYQIKRNGNEIVLLAIPIA